MDWFFAGGNLKKIAVTGGPWSRYARLPTTAAEPGPRMARLCFSRRRVGPDSRACLQRRHAVPLSSSPREKPHIGGRRSYLEGKPFCTRLTTTVAGFDDATLVVQPLAGRGAEVVHRGGYYGRYLRSGHLVYFNQGTLFAEAFDLARWSRPALRRRLLKVFRPIPAAAAVHRRFGADCLDRGGTAVYLPCRTSAGDEGPSSGWTGRGRCRRCARRPELE